MHIYTYIYSRSVVSADFPELADEPEAGNVPGRVRFRHDPRLMVPSDTYFTPEQSNAMVAAIKCPVMLMNAGEIRVSLTIVHSA